MCKVEFQLCFKSQNANNALLIEIAKCDREIHNMLGARVECRLCFERFRGGCNSVEDK